jgi:Type II CAAX prenyl endopeptidase Rce1-like
MRAFIRYFTDYYRSTSRPALFVTIAFIASLVYANYSMGIERRIQAFPWYAAYGAFVVFFVAVIALAWGLQYEWGKPAVAPPEPTDMSRKPAVAPPEPTGKSRKATANPRFFQRPLLILLLLAPLYFAAKMVHWNIDLLLPKSLGYPWTRYWLLVLQLPAKLLLLFCLLFSCWKSGLLQGDSLPQSVGLTTKGFDARPYFLLLLLLVPIVALAATRPDFLQFYPKVKNLAFINGYTTPVWPWKLGYELSYGLDFLSIELFFRGLLVVGLIRYAGEQAILPMAAFYCTIHFGKPLGECITSFFGGLALGVLAYRTRSILGGLIVHLGLAWMMELFGWLGNAWQG